MEAAIGELERVAALHWRAPEESRLGGWLLRAGGGFTGRANSALAVGDPGVPLDDALAAVCDWYRARGLPAMLAVPMQIPGPSSPALDDHLAERAWLLRAAPAFVMTTDLRPHGTTGSPGVLSPSAPPMPPGTGLRMDTEPDKAWLGMYHYRGQELPPVARELLMSAGWQRFASIRDSSGAPVAIARLSVADGWAGITAVEVSTAHRRQGLGSLITRAACAEAARQGVEHVFLQVETGNTAALALYERSGFRYSHRYHYRIAPQR
ncbi:MAG: GCN5-related N-acetyltransferase [Actinomycetia bacterium]|nr:GCN5-related N-acetyltransferase [Actinomycetes bacterium]